MPPDLMHETDAGLATELAALIDRARTELGDSRLDDLAAQLGEPIYVVVMGEFNSGKSALINALLGAGISEEGVVPTTDRVVVISRGEIGTEIVRTRDLVEVHHPSALLEHIRLVDTPGTNSILERHARVTEDFLHRAELVLFVISAERGFSKSERDFLALVRGRWDRKLLAVLNKSDLFDARSLTTILDFVRQGFADHLELVPPIVVVSARRAQQARAEADAALLDASGVAELERHLSEQVAGEARLHLKLESTLAALESILRERATALRDRSMVAGSSARQRSEQLARISAEVATVGDALALRWRAAVDLAYIAALDQRVGRVGSFTLKRAPSSSVDLLTGTAREIEAELATFGVRIAHELAGIQPELEQAQAPAESLDLPDEALRSASRRLHAWWATSGAAAGGLAFCGFFSLVQAPIVAVGALAAGLVGFWRRGAEREALATSLLEQRRRLEAWVEPGIRAPLAEMLRRVRARLEPELALAEGVARETRVTLGRLDALVSSCWSLREQLGSAAVDQRAASQTTR